MGACFITRRGSFSEPSSLYIEDKEFRNWTIENGHIIYINITNVRPDEEYLIFIATHDRRTGGVSPEGDPEKDGVYIFSASFGNVSLLSKRGIADIDSLQFDSQRNEIDLDLSFWDSKWAYADLGVQVCLVKIS